MNLLNLDALQVLQAEGISIRLVTAVMRNPLGLILEREGGQNTRMKTD